MMECSRAVLLYRITGSLGGCIKLSAMKLSLLFKRLSSRGAFKVHHLVNVPQVDVHFASFHSECTVSLRLGIPPIQTASRVVAHSGSLQKITEAILLQSLILLSFQSWLNRCL
jgi:hypothetical protein